MEIILITLLTIVASAIGTITGFGTSTIMIPILALFLSPLEAIFLVSIIHWFGNVWKITLFRSGINWKLIGLFGVTGLVTSYFGAAVTLNIDDSVLLRVLGVFLAVYAIFLLFQSKLKLPVESRLNGPGILCRELKIDKKLNGADLTKSKELRLEDHLAAKLLSGRVRRKKRIGVDYAGEYKDKLWRFVLD